jgi:hypothetical protein
MADDFTPLQIQHLLDLLEAELKLRGVTATMYIVGGAAIALAHSPDRRTRDVDAMFAPEQAVLEAAKAVAEAEGVPPDWLNAHATPWIPPRSKPRVPKPKRAGLRVEVARPEALLAMKLVASRNRDIPDIKLLAEAIDLRDPTAMADLVRDQYGDQLELHGGYDDMLLWCRSLVTTLWPGTTADSPQQ